MAHSIRSAMAVAILVVALLVSSGEASWSYTHNVVITSPAAGQNFTGGSPVTVRWVVKDDALLDVQYFRLDMYRGTDLTPVMEIRRAVELRKFDPSFLWIVPASVTTGTDYWLGVTVDGALEGFGPYDAAGPGQATFGVIEGDSCDAHTECGGDEYCDSNSQCRQCEECQTWNDAIDFVCPDKCGGDLPFGIGDSIPDKTEREAVGPMKTYIFSGCPGYSALVTNANPLIQFRASYATGQPNLMTTRLSDKLDQLAEAFASDVRFTGLEIYVDDAYRVASVLPSGAPVNISDTSLHYEGRAAVITLRNVSYPAASVSPTLIESFGRLCAFLGVDYVQRQSTSYVYISVIPESCTTPIDLVVLLDGSGSINYPQWGGTPGNFENRMLGFVRSIVPMFNFGTTNYHSRLGVATFSNMARVDFHLNAYNDSNSLLTAIDQIQYPSGSTYTSLGLQTVRQQMFTTASGMRDAAIGIPRVLVVITDGVSTSGYAPASEATTTKGAPTNAHIVSIGVSGYRLSELQSMASSDSDVYTLKTFDRIAAIVDQISFRACEARPTIEFGSDSMAVGQCEYLFFQTQCSLSTIVVELSTEQGEVHLYVGNTSNPTPFENLGFDDSSNTNKSVTVSRPEGTSGSWYIGVRGVASGTSRFTLRVWSNFFDDDTVQNVTVAENADAGDLVFEPSASAGVVYSIESGNDGPTPGEPPFAIDTSTGRITVRATGILDYETRTSYQLRVKAQNSVIECNRGIMYINIEVTDFNDVAPVFDGAPFSGGVAINAPIGSPVLQALASDTDAPISYALAEKVTRRLQRRQTLPFTINGSGWITTTQSLSLTTTTYDMVITATDSGVPAQVASADVTVTVLPCNTCGASQFQVSECSGLSVEPVCQDLHTCPAGQYQTVAPTLTSDRECGPCPTGTFQSQAGYTGTSCTPHDTCSGDELLVSAGTATSDAECLAPGPPTVSPTMAPTASPAVGTVDESADGTAEESSATMAWWPALLVLMLLILLIAALLLRQRNKKDDIDVEAQGLNPMYGEFMIGDSAQSAALLTAGQDPTYALAAQGSALWDTFRRCIAFDHMYYGNKPMRLDDGALKCVYMVLGQHFPGSSAIEPLRMMCRQFLSTTVPSHTDTAGVDVTCDEVSEFLWRAVCDDLMERTLDSLARRTKGDMSNLDKDLKSCESDLNADYVPAANEFLVPIKRDPSLRQLPPYAIVEAVYDMSGAMDSQDIYELAGRSSSPGAEYSMANNPSSHEYAVSMPMDTPEDVYTMASGNSLSDMNKKAEPVYELGGVGVTSSTDDDAVYDLGGPSRTSVIYDFGGTSITDSDTDYAMGSEANTPRPTSQVYDNRPGVSPRGQTTLPSIGEALYDMGGVSKPEEATYGLASEVGIRPRAPSYSAATSSGETVAMTPGSTASYNLATSTPAQGAAIVPETYTSAATIVPVTYDTATDGAAREEFYDNMNGVKGGTGDAAKPATYVLASEAVAMDVSSDGPPSLVLEADAVADANDGYIEHSDEYMDTNTDDRDESASPTARTKSYDDALS